EDLALGQARLDVLLIEVGLGLVGSQNLDPVGALGRLGRRQNREAICFGLGRAAAAWVKTNNDVVTAVAEVLRLGMPLASVAKHSDGLALQGVWIGVMLVEDSCHVKSLLGAHGELNAKNILWGLSANNIYC